MKNIKIKTGKTIITLIAGIAMLSQGCADFAELIAESPCVGNDDAEICIQGERAGSLGNTSNLHCCENDIYRSNDARPCYLSAEAQSEIAGEFTSALNISENTSISVDIRTVKYGAFHKTRQGHCEKHNTDCQDELIGQEYKIIGKIEVSSDLTGKVNAVKLLLRELGLDAANIEQATSQVGGIKKTVLKSKGVMASICEKRDHEVCSQVDSPPADMIAVNAASEEVLTELIKELLASE